MPGPGWRRRWRRCRSRRARARRPRPTLQGTCGPISTPACNGSHLLAQLRLAPASPTTWASARPSRSFAAAGAEERGERQATSRACWSRRPRCSPTGRGDRAICAEPQAFVAHPSATPAEKLKTDGRTTGRRRSRHHQLRLPVRMPGSDDAVAAGRARRGAGDQEPGRKQTGGQGLNAETRIALTGTPIENRLGDLWSIFDFINPGLLGREAFLELRQSARRRPNNPTARCATWCGPTSCGA